ncbi:MAG: dihydrofolate reductase family protein [Steroidobacteraceae bacterium]
MSHVVYSIDSTVNGCCDAEQVIADKEHHAYATELTQSADALLFGRNTFDLLEAFWPAAAERTDLPHYMVQFARAIRPVKKYVSSSRPLQTDWPNCILIAGDIRDNIQSLRADNPGTIVIFGSPGLGHSLAAAGEVDEFHFLIQPIAAGGEPRLFKGLSAPIRWPLIDVKPFRSGVLLARYGRASAANEIG